MGMMKGYLVAGLLLCTAGAAFAADPDVTAGPLGKPFALDGKADEWAGVAPVAVKVKPAVAGDAKNKTGEIDVNIRAATGDGNIYFFVEWADSTKSDTHKTLTWDNGKQAYVEGEDAEDRLALNFPIGGDFTACMLSGKEFKSDVWHWKAYRTGSAGYAHDTSNIMSVAQIPKAKKHPTQDGKEIWIARPHDPGTEAYTSQKPIDNIGDKVPRYLVAKAPWEGSVADVKAAAVWANNKWSLELQRKLDTGDAENDVKFVAGKTYKAGVAAFDQGTDDHHSTAAFNLIVK